MSKWRNAEKVGIFLGIFGLFIAVSPPVPNFYLAGMFLVIDTGMCIRAVWESSLANRLTSRRLQMMCKVGGTLIVIATGVAFWKWIWQKKPLPPSQTVFLSIQELTDGEGNRVGDSLVGTFGSIRGGVSKDMPEGCFVQAFMRRITKDGAPEGSWLLLGGVKPERGAWTISNDQFRFPRDWGEENYIEIQIAAAPTLLSAPSDSHLGNQCGASGVESPPLRLSVLVPVVGVSNVAGMSIPAAQVVVPPRSSITGTGSHEFPNEWRIGAYVSKRADNGTQTAWSLEGAASVIGGEWIIRDVDFRLPGYSGSTTTTLVFVAGRELPAHPLESEIRNLQRAANIQPEILTVRSLAPKVTVKINCGQAGATGRISQLHSCDFLNAEISAKNMLEDQESICIAVTPSNGKQEYPLPGVLASIQKPEKWGTRVELPPIGKSLDVVIGITLRRGQGPCSVSANEVVVRKPFEALQ